MGLWQKFKSWVSKKFGGGNSSKSYSRSNYRSPSQRTYTSSSGSYSNRDNDRYFSRADELRERREEQKRKREEQERNRKRIETYKAKDTNYKSMAQDAVNNAQSITKSLESAVKKTPPTRREKIDTVKAFKNTKATVDDEYAITSAGKKAIEKVRQKKEAEKQKYKLTDKDYEMREIEVPNQDATGNWDGTYKKVKVKALNEKGYEKKLKGDKAYRYWESGSRGLLSGASLGASELALKKTLKDDSQEKVYQKNKSKGAEVVGELAGSLITLGGAGKVAQKKAGELTGTKLGTKAVNKIAGTKAIGKLSERAATKAVEKGVAKSASKGLVKEIANQKARKIVEGLIENTAVDLTAGAVYDINKASAEHEVGSKEWWKELGSAAAFNVGASGLATGINALGKTSAVESALEALGKRRKAVPRNVMSDDALKSLANTGDSSTRLGRKIAPPTVNVKRSVQNATGVDISKPLSDTDIGKLRTMRDNLADSLRREPQGSEQAKSLTQKLKNIDRVLNRVDDTAESVAKTVDDIAPTVAKDIDNIAPTVARSSDEVAETVRRDADELQSLKNELDQLEADAEAHKISPQEFEDRAEALENRIEELEKSSPTNTSRLDEINDELEQAHKVAGDVNQPQEVREAASERFDELMAEKRVIEEGEVADDVADDVKTALNDDLAERRKNAREFADERAKIDEQIREKSEGAVGTRKSAETMVKGTNEENQKRLYNKMVHEADEWAKGNIENASASETLYSTWDSVRKRDAAVKSAERVSNDIEGVENGLIKKLETFEANPNAGTNLSIDDVMDMTAIKQFYKDTNQPFPKQLEETFSKLILANKTEHAQGLSVIEQILREFDPDYRQVYITNDIDKYVKRFGNVRNADEAAKYYDRQFGKGAFKKRLNEFINMKKTDLPEGEYKKMYQGFLNEILRTSKPSFWNVWDSIRHSFMLFGGDTAMRNVEGNLAQRVMYNISDVINMGFESAMARRVAKNPELLKQFGEEGFERTTKVLPIGSDNKMLAKQLRSGWLGGKLDKIGDSFKGAKDKAYVEYLTNVFKEDIPELVGVEKLMPYLEKGADFVPETAAERILYLANKGGQKMSKAVSFMLNEPDSWFVERNYRSSLMKYLQANGITDMASLNANKEVFARARAYAKDVALENTYKKASRVTTFIEQARQAGRREGSHPALKVGSLLLDTRLPYVKVPVNMFKNMANYSPIGLTTNGTKAVKAIMNGDMKGLQQAERELSKSLTGTGLMALGFMLHVDENEQADADSVGVIHNAADYLKNNYGYRDNVLKVGDLQFKLSDIGLGAAQILMGTAYAEALNEMGGAPKGLLANTNAILSAFDATLDVIEDQSLLENFTAMFDAASNKGDYEMKANERVKNVLADTLPQLGGQFVPKPLKAIGKGFTEYDIDAGVNRGKDTTQLGRSLQKGVNNVVQSLPYVNENGLPFVGVEGLPHKVDVHGRPISTGLFPEGRDTTKKKALQSLANWADPHQTRKIKIPEVDREEMKVMRTGKDSNGEPIEPKPFVPKGFDANRKHEAKIGEGDHAMKIDLTSKEREQVARATQNGGRDAMQNLVDHGVFGDRLGKRAQQMLKSAPENLDEMREMYFQTPEWKNASAEQKEQQLEWLYGEDGNGKGVRRTQNAEAFINIKGGDEGEFRWQNDLSWQSRDKYVKNKLEEKGISKEDWVNITESVADANHKWTKEGGNYDVANSAKKTMLGILTVAGLTPEQRVTAYNLIRGKRTTFGWKDWDGVTAPKSSGSYRRRGYRRYRRRGRGRKTAVPKSTIKINAKAYKPDVAKTKSMAEGLPTGKNAVKIKAPKTRKSATTKSSLKTAKITPPKVKMNKYEV